MPGQARRLCVCVFGGMVVTMAVGAAQGFLREQRLGASRDSVSFPPPTLDRRPSSAPQRGQEASSKDEQLPRDPHSD